MSYTKGLRVDSPREWLVVDDGGFTVATFISSRRRIAEDERNARMFVAGGPMLEALERFVDRAQSWHDFHHGTDIQCDELCECIPEGRAAIALAKGEKP